MQSVDPMFLQPHKETQHILLMIEEVERWAREIESYLPSKQRGKQVLVNVGSAAIKFLFGNPDADGLETIQAGLVATKNERSPIVQVIREHLVVSRTLGNREHQTAPGDCM
uniref:Uncharacterized protein n=1 Tax=Lygus hesperus TaxID=30085 RepID=A0A0K8TEE4_LYGHE